MPVGATLGAAAIGGGASIISANKAKKTANNVLTTQQNNLGEIKQAINPFLLAGQSALGQISDPASVSKNFQASPDFGFRMQQGIDQVLQSKGVNSMLRSGSAIKAVQDRASSLASGEFGNWWNRQSGLAGMGTQAAGVLNGVATNGNAAIANNGQATINANNQTIGAVGELGGSLIEILNQKYGKPPTADASSYGGGGLPADLQGLL